MDFLDNISKEDLYSLLPDALKERLRARLTLVQKIQDSDSSEDEIIDLLKQPIYQKEINEIILSPHGDETLLMWAVWMFKKRVVIRLLELGADIKFVNDIGSSVSTYWDHNKIKTNDQLACEIAEILHRNGADLSQEGCQYNCSLVTKVKEGNFQLLMQKVKELGY